MLPVGHMVNEVLLKHMSPFPDGVKKCLFERTRIDTEPAVNYYTAIQFFHFIVQFLISINLSCNKSKHLFTLFRMPHWKADAWAETIFVL